MKSEGKVPSVREADEVSQRKRQLNKETEKNHLIHRKRSPSPSRGRQKSADKKAPGADAPGR